MSGNRGFIELKAITDCHPARRAIFSWLAGK
jgi:hypothetical protein